jgi:hypothetical protein
MLGTIDAMVRSITRVAIVIDSPYIPESKEYFMITEKGIEDAPSAD